MWIAVHAVVNLSFIGISRKNIYKSKTLQNPINATHYRIQSMYILLHLVEPNQCKIKCREKILLLYSFKSFVFV